MSGLLFVTAETATHKTSNLILLHLRDWDTRSENIVQSDNSHCLVTTKNAYDLEKPEDANVTKPTHLPVPSDISNAWIGASISDIEAFVLDLNKSGTKGVQSSIFFCLDDKGMQDKTIIIGERRYDEDGDELTDFYNKTRAPWDEAHTVWQNLDIGNVGWEDYCDEEKGADDDGWWDYAVGGADIMTENERAKRGEAIKKMEDEDLV
ncbi:hypothetical protein LTR37_012067 [Vermiconidia calcicola]|uniref:Uncharacterized protein n=1 Tax=Vermiconidia calcicola TaxID=1690605 RepID=A0ACC3N229_9PEZI|nr:hypothetical protein LTR37_012067 [Vermiconidia calcicola]